MKDKVTIIIPTHNRPLLIGRAVAYYGKWDCRIIICDSSTEIQKINKKNIDHIHFPGEFFSQKIKHALELVTTPFVCLCADDDFLAYHGVLKGLEFLEMKQDYVSVQGKYVQFWLSEKIISCVPLYHRIYGMHINDSDPGQRIIDSANLGMHQLYSLYRTEILKKTFFVCGDEKAATLTEYSSNLVGMFYGKHIMLPVFWMARDAKRYTEYNVTLNNANTVIQKPQLKDFLLSEQGQQFRRKFCDLFSKVTGKPEIEANHLFDKVFFDIYLVDTPSKPVAKTSEISINQFSKPWSIKSIVKEILPAPVRKKYRQFTKSLVPKFILQRRNSRLYPFPFSEDQTYLNDWKEMTKIIKLHGSFPSFENSIVQ